MSETKDVLFGLLNYVEAMARMTEHTVFSVRSYRMLTVLEHELQNRIGIQHNIVDHDGTIWLRIERLPPIDPPAPDSEMPSG